MEKFTVFYNAHKYIDCSDAPKASHRIVKAENAEEARQILVDMRQNDQKVGQRYIGCIHHAEREE
jgi:hypothetical protein